MTFALVLFCNIGTDNGDEKLSLKQHIVIRNEFTTKNESSRGGSRGGSPGRYVMRYMARKGAVEPVTPIRRFNSEEFVLRYMARASATEKAESRGEARQVAEDISGYGGVAFGYGQVSLSDEGVRQASDDIQRLFDQGHTVMKTILSFDNDYLEETGVIPKGFKPKKRGDYRGKVDQMRLRMAIMRGLERMSSEYDDLRYVGVIQVDTMQVHCHLAMVDAGRGTVVEWKGRVQQKGKINSASKSLLRRGIDAWLDDNQHVAHMSSSVMYERLNVTSFVKKWVHEKVLDESLPQLLLACLPENKNLWRYSSNRMEMRRPNAIAREMVTEVLSREGSPMNAAMLAVNTYADKRKRREGLSSEERDRLVDQGQELIIERCVNGVYQVLSSLPENVVSVRTPMLDRMSQDIESLMAEQAERVRSQARGVSADDDLVGFTLKLRSYGSRLKEHDEQRQIWRERAAQWEAAERAGAVDPSSVVMHQLYLEEEEYHARCASKYRRLLGPLALGVQSQDVRGRDDGRWRDLLADVDNRRRSVVGLEALLADRSIPKMKDAEEAERLGLDSHGVSGGRLLVAGKESGRAQLKRRLKKLKDTLVSKTSDLISVLSGRGLMLRAIPEEPEQKDPDLVLAEADDVSVVGELEPIAGEYVQEPGFQVVTGERWSLQETKGLDLHDVRSDSVVDVTVGPRVSQSFIDWARWRTRLVEDAARYLVGTDQAEVARQMLPINELRRMNQTAAGLAEQLERRPGENTVLRSALSDIASVKEKVRRSATVSLDEGMASVLEEETYKVARELPAQIDEIFKSQDREIGE